VTRDEAKQTLALYRPGTADRDDPEFAEALALAQRDPELARWLADHCALQAAIRAKFQQIAVPDGLKEQILSERKARFMPVLQRRTVLLAAAAALVFLALGVWSLYQRPREDNSFSNFRDWMARKVLRGYPQMDRETNDLKQILQYVADHGPRGDYALPKPLAKTSPTGCAVFPWHGRSVAMVCFNSGKMAPPTTPDLFLFVISRSEVEKPPATNALQMTRVNALVAASWSAGDKTYVLAGLGDEAFIRHYVSYE